MRNREGLVQLYSQGVKEIEVTARIKEFGTTVNRKLQTMPTMLLVDIRDAKTNERLAEHSWVIVRYNTGERMAIGKTIKFIANIQRYNGNKIGIGYLRKSKEC